MGNKRGHRGFGNVRKLPSGRYQARYTGPDGKSYSGASTFSAKAAAERWIAARQDDVATGRWTPDSGRKAPMVPRGRTFGSYADEWLERAQTRPTKPLKPRTAELYRRLLDRLILPTFSDAPIRSITAEMVDQWHDSLGSRTPTQNAHAYALLRAIMQSASTPKVRLIETNPCAIPGAGRTKRARKIKTLTMAELAALVEAMPERHQLMVLLAAWCSLRYGELTELRRSDIDLTNGLIHVRRGVVRTSAGFVVGTPKSDAGVRDVYMPPHIVPALRAHLNTRVNGRDGLLFPAADGITHLTPSAFYGRPPERNRPGRGFYGARLAAGRPDLAFHHLRHTGAVLAAQTGATIAELMARLGHSTPAAAMIYQHAGAERDKAIAAKLSEIAGGAK